jgi:hypothetical protein
MKIISQRHLYSWVHPEALLGEIPVVLVAAG